MEEISRDRGISLDATAELVVAYVSNNVVRHADLPDLIRVIHSSVVGLGTPAPRQEFVKAVPAVSIKKSVTPDAIISLIDGKRYKTLRKHLTANGLTPDEYRTQYGLPHAYPMIAASYSAKRSELAKVMGLGQRHGPKPVVASEPKRSRPKPAT